MFQSVPRRGGQRLSPARRFVLLAALLSEDRITNALWDSKMVLAGMDLHADCDGVGLPLSVPQPRPLVPRCRGQRG